MNFVDKKLTQFSGLKLADKKKKVLLILEQIMYPNSPFEKLHKLLQTLNVNHGLLDSIYSMIMSLTDKASEKISHDVMSKKNKLISDIKNKEKSQDSDVDSLLSSI